MDTSRPFAETGAYSRPYVAASGGKRAGPLTGYFAEVNPGGVPLPGLSILSYAKANLIEFDASGSATAVHYAKRDGVDQSQAGVPGVARLRSGGMLVMAAGALATPRLLLLSGVGPRGREAEIFPGQSRAPFAIDNPRVGVGVFDHVISMIAYEYSGAVPYTSYNYGDYAGNASDLARFLANGSGPYAQYQPVSILNVRDGADVPNVEVFVNPNGAGGVLSLDAKGNVNYPSIYMPESADGAADIALMAKGVYDMIQLFAQNPALKILFGPGSASHPNLKPNVLADVRTYVTSPSPVDGVYYSRLTANHFGGTARLASDAGGVDPATLILRGTRNVAVVDASLLPTQVAAHPVGTIMAVADRAGDLLAARWS
jgi:choline dehydrogenase-like flavoprotein